MPTAATSSTGASPGGPIAGVATTTGKKAKSNPAFNFGFEGLNHYQQRYSRGGNQFSVEPPDQGMCAGNGYVVENRQRCVQRLQPSDRRIASSR